MRTLPMAMFWLLGLIWGSAFIYMKLASQLISPSQIVLLRVLFGFVVVGVYAGFQGAMKWSHIRHVAHFLVMAVVGTIGYYYGFARGASQLPSGVVGALSGLTPILSFLLALWLLSEEKLSRTKAIGVLIGFLGVLLIARPFAGGMTSPSAEGVFFSLMGSFCVGASFVYAKKYVIPLNLPAAAVTAYQLGISLIVLCLLIDLQGVGQIWSDPYAAWGLILGLGVLGTGVALVLYYYIIQTLGAVAASSVAYITPVVAILIGVFLADEHIDVPEYLGAALIFAGLVLVTRRV